MARFIALLLPFFVLTGCALPASAPEADAPDRVVVAEIVAEAIQPRLSPPAVASLAMPYFDDVEKREGKRPRFEQSWIKRGPGPSGYTLQIDSQFADGNDFLIVLELDEVDVDGSRLLVLILKD